MRIILVFLLIYSIFLPAAASSVVPLLTQDQNPLIRGLGLPLATPGELNSQPKLQFSYAMDISNTLNINNSNNETLLIDGETYAFNFIVDFKTKENWGLRLTAPIVRYAAGFLDRPIERYHDIFGFGQGERLSNPRDRLLFFYQRNNIERLRLSSSKLDLSDIQLSAGRQFISTQNSTYSVWFNIELPTGDPKKLTGNDAIDVAAWIAGQHAINTTWQLYGTTGLLYANDGDFLPELQENQIQFGTLGTQARFWPKVMLKTQLDWHSRFYKNTSSRFLGDVIQLTFGGTWNISNKISLDFAIAEDIKEDASPDVNFHILLRVKNSTTNP